MTQTIQKTIYQHSGQYLDLKNGIEYTGCFRTYEEAKKWRASVMSKGANEGGLCSKHGVSPYGAWERHFDVEAYFERLKEWAGDYEFTGRD